MQGLTIRLSGEKSPALVIGGAGRAVQVVEKLLCAGLSVRLCSPHAAPGLRRRIATGEIDWRPRPFSSADLADARLVIAAGADDSVNRRLGEAARAAGKLFLDAMTGEGDFQLIEPPSEPDGRDDLWAHVQVCLLGAGPGDPGLLTLDGRQALAGADVVLYDRLVSTALLDIAPPGAERRFVGKRRDHHHMQQADLNALMIRLARQGHRVVRLKGGDPFVFGRGGEEVLELAEAGIASRVIPGVTAGSGCATYADIPLTHRGVAASCQFLTAHGRHGELKHDWPSLVRENHTLVVYMGVLALKNLCPALVRHGMRTDMPAALIERGTFPEQRVLTGTVSTLPTLAARHTISSPAVLIVGEVVALRDRIQRARAIETVCPVETAGSSLPREF